MGVSAATINKLPWIIGGAVIVLAGHLLAVSTTIAERVSEFFAAKANAHAATPDALKLDLGELLRHRDRPLVVVIDDIDRLTSEEIRLVFRLIKANADLPRILYFVLFERDAVIHALQREGFASGEQYLEKIVQAPFVVPVLQASMLLDVLVARLNDILRQLPDSLPVDEDRWADLFFQHLRVYFDTLRDVYRFLAAFEFHAGVFREGESYEVNVVDLFALEILRIFEPQVYDRLPSSKRMLVHGSIGLDRSTDASKKVLEAMLDGAQQPKAVKAALSSLFPRASWAWDGHAYGEGFEPGWTTSKRVGTETHFEKYFYLTVPKGDITQAELDRFIANTRSRESTREFMQAVKRDGRIQRFLLRLEFEKDRIPLDHVVPFVTAMLDEGDDLPRRTEMWGLDPEVTGIIYRYLIRLKTLQERQASLRAAILTTEGVYGPARLVWFEEPRDEGQRSSDRTAIISEQALPEFEQLCSSKISAAAERGKLLTHPHLVTLLYRWSKWTDGLAVREWAEKIASNPTTVIVFLRSFVQTTKQQGLGSVVTRQIPRLDLKSLEEFVPLEVVETTLSGIEPTTDSDEQAVKLFRKALERRRKGLPDRESLATDDDDDQ